MDVESKKTVHIDGGYGEGGGQIIRIAVTLACILRQKIDVENIRANRPNPGLASQHLESIRAMMRISGASTTKEPRKQATEFNLDGTVIPPFSEGVKTSIDLVTAGSCTLCIQCILPYLMCLKSPSRIRIIGGTHVMKSPSFDYLDRVFLPIFNTLLGNNIKAVLIKPGYFPRGNGSIDLEVNPNFGKFTPFILVERGPLKKIEAILNVTPKMKGWIPQFRKAIAADTNNIEVRDVPFASIEYFLQFEKSYAGFSFLVEGRNPQPNQLLEGINKVQCEMKGFLSSSAAVDTYMQDQLIIYMALAKLTDRSTVSKIRTTEPSPHTNSAILVSQLFAATATDETNDTFTIEYEESNKSFAVVL